MTSFWPAGSAHGVAGIQRKLFCLVSIALASYNTMEINEFYDTGMPPEKSTVGRTQGCHSHPLHGTIHLWD